MLKIQLQYHNNILCIHLRGLASTKEIERLKNNISVIICEYNIQKIQLEIDNYCNIDYNDFDEFINILNHYHYSYDRRDNLYFKGLRA